MNDQDARQAYSLPRIAELCTMLSEMLPELPGILYRCRANARWTMLDLADPVRELTGYPPEALIEDAELSWADLIHEEDRDRVHQEVFRALERGLPFRTSYRIRTRSGDVRRVWEQGRRARGSDDLIGFIQDVTDWRRKLDDLKESTRLLERTIASLEEAVIVIDTSGEGRGILRVNAAAERIFGYSRDELQGRTTEMLHVSRASFEAFAEELEPILKAEGVVRASYPMRRKDGTEFAAEQTVTLLDPEAGISGGAVSVIRDVSEREQLQQQLRRSQRLEAIGRLAGGVAHDFNNLLTVIRAHSDFTVMELDEASPLVNELRAIQQAADRAADLTNQLLAFSREQVLRPRVMDINAVVTRVDRLLGRVIEEPIEVRSDLHPEPVPVRVDPGQLERALVNLAVNARDAMPDGGTLTLRTGIDRDEDASYARLSVQDTGVGMDAETRSRIFEPFFTTKEQGSGTGLGLATTYGFVTQTGGTIRVESSPGDGSTFILRFPVSDEAPEAESEPRAAPVGSLDGRTVLVVEDEANVRRVIERALTRRGCTVRTAATGEEGVEILQRDRDVLNLVITDLVLPGISGREVAERALQLETPIPAIIMSGYAADTGRTDDIPPEAAFLEKPFTAAEMVARVKEHLG